MSLVCESATQRSLLLPPVPCVFMLPMLRYERGWRQLLVLAFSLTMAACGAEEAEEERCSGQGWWHRDHCHCNAGFTPSASRQECLPVEPVPDTPPPQPRPADDGEPLDDLLADAEATIEWAEADGYQLRIVSDAMRISVILGPGPAAGERVELTIDGEEVSRATCVHCLTVELDCARHGEAQLCDRLLMPRAGGTVAWGTEDDAHVVSFDGIVVRDVSVAAGGVTTDVDGGGTRRLDRVELVVVDIDAPR